jgi:hypothetical protein
LVLTYRASSPTVDEKALVRNPAFGTQMPAVAGEELAKLDRHKLVGMSSSVAVGATVGDLSVQAQAIRAPGGARKSEWEKLGCQSGLLANEQLLFQRDTASALTHFAPENQQQELLPEEKL